MICSMASELITAASGVGGVVLGVAGTLLAARMQARSTHAQAEAALDSMSEQLRTEYKSWMASDRTHAYTALITEALTLEGKIKFLKADFNRSDDPWWNFSVQRLGYRERLKDIRT